MDDRPIILNRDPKEKRIFVGNANYRFDNKKYTLGGWLSLALAAGAVLVLGFSVYAAYRAKGGGGFAVGGAGFIGFLMTVAGFIISIMSFQEEDKNYLFTRIGMGVNFLLLLLWGCVYLIGI